MKYVGTRVIRGPDWSGGNEDGGEGSLGTVINAYDSVGKVKVMWDFGGHGIYKAGSDGKHELLLYDNGPTGVIHTSVVCDGKCKDKMPLTGIRWKCRECEDFDLCTRCFMDQTHNQNHKFLRQTTPSTTVYSTGDGHGNRVITLHGILPGASVTRGVDWESGNEDGGKRNEGVVEKLTKWGSTSYDGSALVKWSNGFRTNYRVGGDGCVDLLCFGESRKYLCVPAYLPVLGNP
ncbi:hypothetical protein LOTGIDRAFT_125402 [Lottia gigantea]|uniref:ZZ-type domain-containing protein n=1 Tax=Lottia gigantea TaxID=225164 RepID=V4A1E7_LOTGI|nr:hypothetical protein LOTGIDRAFT_125402 [Lottia gigantea]ESO88755.1 hypothetical protein LOTGIDRAFT_125402 [Lottia gigantea]